MKRRTLLFVGCDNFESGSAPRPGIAVYAFDDTTGVATPLSIVSDIDNPSFLAIDAEKLLVYATSEVAEHAVGSAAAYALDPDSGILTYIERQSTLGSLACHLSLDRSRNYLFATNFDRGIVGDSPAQALTVLPTRGRTGLSAATTSRKHSGSGPVRPYQDCPHAHCAVTSVDNRFLLVTDLGTDRITSYGFEEETGSLTSASRICEMPPGSGPRHLIFSPDGRTAFVSNELNSTVSAVAYDPETGRLTIRQILTSLPDGAIGANYPADIHLGSDGRFLYVSNRGHDSIAVFKLDHDFLSPAGHFSTGGKWPRSFAISPDGRYLLVANQHSDQIMTFKIEPDSGALTRTTEVVDLKAPLFVTLASIGVE
jgi:6-phosphogluconolactonase